MARLALHEVTTGSVIVPACFRLTARDGGLIAASPAWITGGKPPHQSTTARPLTLCVPSANPYLGFLVADDTATISIVEDMSFGVAVALRLEQQGALERVELVHVLNPAFRFSVMPRPRVGGASIFELQIRRRAADPEHVISVTRIDPESLPSGTVDVALEIERVITPGLSWEAVFEHLRNGTLRLSLADAILRSLNTDELHALSYHLVEDEKDRRLLQLALPNDAWIVKRLPSLIGWRQNRDTTSPAGEIVKVADSGDLPGTLGNTTHRPSLGLLLNAAARRATRPRRMACVLGCARNEGAYLIEWIAYYRAIGFDHVFLYSNNNTDGSDELLRLLAEAGVITWFDNEVAEGTLPQFKSYSHALSVMPQILDYRWTLVADLDEYFGFDTPRFRSVIAYLSWQEMLRADAIAVPWLLYVARPEDRWTDATSIERFPHRAEHVNHHIKSMFRTNLFWASNPHHPAASFDSTFNYRSENGLRHAFLQPQNTPSLSAKPVASHAWMAHYIFRSAPEALMKMARGNGDGPIASRGQGLDRILEPFMTLACRRPLVCDTRIARCATDMGSEMTLLHSIPGVSTCLASIKANRLTSMRDVCRAFLDVPLRIDSTEDYQGFRAIIERHVSQL